jgi:hypothetical protein
MADRKALGKDTESIGAARIVNHSDQDGLDLTLISMLRRAATAAFQQDLIMAFRRDFDRAGTGTAGEAYATATVPAGSARQMA